MIETRGWSKIVESPAEEAVAVGNRKKQLSKVLVAVALVALVATIGVTSSWKQPQAPEGQTNHKSAIASEQGTTKTSEELAQEQLRTSDNMVTVSEDGLATSQTGVYYLPSDPSKCFIIKSSPWNVQRGWNLQPSDAMASTMISAFGWVAAINPTRGKVMIWNGAKQRKETNFVFMGSTITIDGVMYERRPKQAQWECKPNFSQKTPVYAKPFGAANCQWLVLNPTTKGFVIEYSKGPGNMVAGGGGYFDAAANKGEVGGYHHSGALDGIYGFTYQSSPAAYLLWTGATRFAGGGWDFIVISTCVDPGYPTVTQKIGPEPTYPTGVVPKTDADYRVTAQASWSQAAVACMADGLTLCTKAQYCSGGDGQNPDLGKLLGDVWAPIGDMFQNFVQLADPNRICNDHLGKYSVLPKWEYYGTQNTVFRCCVKPAALSSLSPPMQELILNDAEYRFVLDGSWQKAQQVCTADGMRLCTELEYCPNGGYQIPLLGTIPGGDVWAPITDSRYPSGNNWVQLSDLGRVCKTHADLYKVLPTWPSCCTGGKKTAFRCCH